MLSVLGQNLEYFGTLYLWYYGAIVLNLLTLYLFLTHLSFYSWFSWVHKTTSGSKSWKILSYLLICMSGLLYFYGFVQVFVTCDYEFWLVREQASEASVKLSPKELVISLPPLAFLHSLPWREGTWGLTSLLNSPTEASHYFLLWPA